MTTRYLVMRYHNYDRDYDDNNYYDRGMGYWYELWADEEYQHFRKKIIEKHFNISVITACFNIYNKKNQCIFLNDWIEHFKRTKIN